MPLAALVSEEVAKLKALIATVEGIDLAALVAKVDGAISRIEQLAQEIEALKAK